MKTLLKFAAFLLSLIPFSLSAQSIYVKPASPHVPTGGVQSLVAMVTGSANTAVTWTKTGAACTGFVGSGNTIGVSTSGTGTCTVTATMNADGTTAASTTVTVEALRPDLQAASTHPRIGLTSADVTDLLTKTGSGNLLWTKGLNYYFTECLGNTCPNGGITAYYDTNFCFTGAGCGAIGPRNSQIATDNGGWTYNQWGVFENDIAVYAVMALIDPTTGNRATWAAHARDMMVWYMDQVCGVSYGSSGPCVARDYGNAATPWIGWKFSIDNRSQHTIFPLGQAIDWDYSAFSSTDKALFANVFHIWGQQMSADFVAADVEHPIPIGTYNNVSLINTNAGMAEWGFNNYSIGHFRNLVAMGLALDPADDPNISACAGTVTTVCTDGSANTVRAYVTAANKAWLYRIYANAEDAHIVDAAYGLADPFQCPDMMTNTLTTGANVPCTGQMSGGMSSEGSDYGPLSMQLMFPAVYALYTAGKLNPAVDPQAAFITSSFWDKMAIGQIHMLFPNWEGTLPNLFYRYTPFGDEQNTYVIQEQTLLFNEMQLYDAKFGSASRIGLEKWYQYNVSGFSYPSYFCRFIKPGGLYALNMMMAMSATADGDFSTSGELQFDCPISVPNAYDPRGSGTLPVEFEAKGSNGSFYKYFGRSDWTSTASQFQFMSDSAWINHAGGLAGRFDYTRKGEGLIYSLGGYQTATPINNNQAAYQWNPSFDCSLASVDQQLCIDGGLADNSWAGGSSFMGGTSYSPTYYFGAVNGKNSYSINLSLGSANVTQGNRDVFWLKPDQIFVYDRGSSSIAGFKRFWLDLTAVPTVSGNTASMTSTGGQKLYVTAVLPVSGATMTATAISPTQPNNTIVKATLETNTGTSTDVRMLHVIEGKDSGAKTATSLVQSTAGDGFDGSVVGGNLVMFMRTPGPFSNVTFPASGASTVYVADLVPNTIYPTSGAVSSGSAESDSAGVLVISDTGSGSITIGAGTPIAATPTFSPVAGTYVGTQTVTISTITASPTIYYTTDGSTPTTGSTVYSGPVAVSVSETLKALATASGFSDSAVGSATYVITVPTVPQGSVSGTVTISGTVSIP